MRKRRSRRGFDEAWKYAVPACFRECLQLLFPAVRAQVDWTHPVKFQETTCTALCRAGAADTAKLPTSRQKLIFATATSTSCSSTLRSKAQPDPKFALRMFVYHYHIFDSYDYPEVVSLAVLADNDPNWRPSSFGYRNVGSWLQFGFTTVKLLDLNEAELERSENPFALVVLAHLRALKTRGKPNLMVGEKIALIRRLKESGYTAEQVIHLYKVVDFMMTLSQELEQLVKQVVRKFEEESEWPLTSLEELAIEEGARKGLQQGLEQGRQEGLQQGIERGLQQGIVEVTVQILQRRFGETALALVPLLKQVVSLEQLRALSGLALDAPTLEEFQRALEAVLAEAQR